MYGKELIIRRENDEENEQFIQLTGREARHHMIQQVVKVYMKDLAFGSDGFATAYRAYVYGSVEVQMNPQFRFGEPLIPSCGYSARALWEAVHSEGSLEAAANELAVSINEVEAAYRYWQLLRNSRVA